MNKLKTAIVAEVTSDFGGVISEQRKKYG